jgi:quercetin dioxygenase-like cupin family protein
VKATVVRSTELHFEALPGRASADPFRASTGTDDTNVSVRVVRLVHDPHRTAHVHDHSAETVYVVSGHGTLWVDGQRTPLQAGDTVLIPAGTPHATLPDPGAKMLLVCFFPHPDLATNIEELTGPLA